MPIVPGVCQTQILAEVLSQALKTDLHLKSAASIKFLSIVDPTKTPSLDLIIIFTKNEDGTYNVSAQYKSGETVFFKFKGVFAA
jgi:3-hydroxyacyl-[acyl-carrier-protein] dehydratase